MLAYYAILSISMTKIRKILCKTHHFKAIFQPLNHRCCHQSDLRARTISVEVEKEYILLLFNMVFGTFWSKMKKNHSQKTISTNFRGFSTKLISNGNYSFVSMCLLLSCNLPSSERSQDPFSRKTLDRWTNRATKKLVRGSKNAVDRGVV